MIGRRGFLKAIGVGVLGLSLALRRPETAIDFAPQGNDTGMAVRFIRHWDPVESKTLAKIDVMYGWGRIQPEFAVRVSDPPSPWWQRLVRWAA